MRADKTRFCQLMPSEMHVRLLRRIPTFLELAPCPLILSCTQVVKVSSLAFSIALLVGTLDLSGNTNLMPIVESAHSSPCWRHIPSMTIHVLPQPTSNVCPATLVGTFLVVDVEWVVVRFPIAELLVTHEARHIVNILGARVVVESCLCEGIRVGCK